MNTKISIIIPIYNGEKYIERCLKSIINQDYEELEIILINDGSTDKSIDILKKFKNIDNRIKVIDKENTGVSDTRNRGIEEATGDYIMFIDVDDYLEENMIKKIINTINKKDIDLIKFNYNITTSDGKKEKGNEDYEEYKEKNLDKQNIEHFIDNILLGKVNAYVWTLVIKREIIGNIRFNKEIGMMEDLLFYINILSKTNNLYIMNDRLYNYFINTESVCNSPKYYYRNFCDMLKVYDLIINELKNQKQLNENRKKILTFAIIMGIESIFYRVCSDKKIDNEILDKMIKDNKLEELLKNDIGENYIPFQRKISINLIQKKNKLLLITFNKFRYKVSKIKKKI